MSQFSDTADSFSDTSGDDVGSYDFKDGFLIEDEEDDVSSMASSSELDPTHELSDLLTDMTLEERELHHNPNPKPRDRHPSDHFPVDYASADPRHGADVEGLPSESENTEESSSEYTPSGSEYYSSENDY